MKNSNGASPVALDEREVTSNSMQSLGGTEENWKTRLTFLSRAMVGNMGGLLLVISPVVGLSSTGIIPQDK